MKNYKHFLTKKEDLILTVFFTAMIAVSVLLLQGCDSEVNQENYYSLKDENSSLQQKIDDYEYEISELEQEIDDLQEELEYKDLAIEEREETVQMFEDSIAQYGAGFWYEYTWYY